MAKTKNKTKESYRNVRKERYTQISNDLLNDSEATLQAKGLLSILISNKKDWEIHMTEIIKRSNNGRDAHYNIINELIFLGYFARVKVLGERNRFEEIVYMFSDEKIDVEKELEDIKKWAKENNKNLVIEYKDKKEKKQKGDSESPNTSEKPLPENQDTENEDTENQYINNTKSKKTKTNKKNKDIKNDDDKRTGSSPKDIDESINLIISNFREETKEEITSRSFNAVTRKVVDKYKQGKVNSFRDYLATALIRKIEELELRRIKENAKQQSKFDKEKVAERINNRQIKKVPFYNWLDN
uniref:Nuclease n=1 Tax=Aeromonas sp. Ne-1 TaxID=1675689 RepID=A0A0H4JD29_9GAMM|nr:hypothetical protein [Aeromonas sp. Ne-1]AKO69697.1 nuclease [Aeromonas sp. Ne-1]